MNPRGSTISHIFLKTSHGAPMEAVKSATAITGEGLQNDVSRGRKLRQILIVDALTIQEFGLSPGALRENIILEGQSLSNAEAGTVIQIGAATLEVTLDCSPCDLLDNIRPGLQDDMEGRRGTLCRVLNGGVITIGDVVTLSD